MKSDKRNLADALYKATIFNSGNICIAKGEARQILEYLLKIKPMGVYELNDIRGYVKTMKYGIENNNKAFLITNKEAKEIALILGAKRDLLDKSFTPVTTTLNDNSIQVENSIKFRNDIRQAVADYIYSEGCSCCRSSNHTQHAEVLGKLLDVPQYSDGSGYEFSKYRTTK